MINTIIKSQTINLLNDNKVLFIEKSNSIEIIHPNLGKCEFWIKKNKLHIHSNNEWIENGYYYLLNSF